MEIMKRRHVSDVAHVKPATRHVVNRRNRGQLGFRSGRFGGGERGRSAYKANYEYCPMHGNRRILLGGSHSAIPVN